jgi:hypothetical protein
MRSRNVEVFLEDKTILEAQQQTMKLLPTRSLQNFGIDKGGLQARRAITRLVANESGATPGH